MPEITQYYLDRYISDAVPYIIALIIGIVLGVIILLAFMPLRKRSNYLHRPSQLAAHDFLNFRTMASSWFLKSGYIMCACALTLYSIVMIFDVGFIDGISLLIFGNAIVRILYEASIIIFSIHRNLEEIANKLSNRQVDPTVNASDIIIDVGSQIKKQQQRVRTRVEEASSQNQRSYRQRENSSVPERKSNEPNLRRGHTSLVCHICGAAISETAKFCKRCGNAR